jgi:hypothetical protein
MEDENDGCDGDHFETLQEVLSAVDKVCPYPVDGSHS